MSKAIGAGEFGGVSSRHGQGNEGLAESARIERRIAAFKNLPAGEQQAAIEAAVANPHTTFGPRIATEAERIDGIIAKQTSRLGRVKTCPQCWAPHEPERTGWCDDCLGLRPDPGIVALISPPSRVPTLLTNTQAQRLAEHIAANLTNVLGFDVFTDEVNMPALILTIQAFRG